MAEERRRSHELVGSMVGAVYVHVLRTLIPRRKSGKEIGKDNRGGELDKVRMHREEMKPENNFK